MSVIAFVVVAVMAGLLAAHAMSGFDNPVVLPDGRVESNGNFHGAPVAAGVYRLPGTPQTLAMATTAAARLASTIGKVIPLFAGPSFGVFISGPSKTADIEHGQAQPQ